MLNKKPMGLPEKQFQSWNTFAKSYAYTKTLIKKEKKHYLLFENYGLYL